MDRQKQTVAPDALATAIAGMPARAAALVAKWRAEDAVKRVRFHAPSWPGHVPRLPQGEPHDYWITKQR